jgi:hypothetical protein
MFSESMLSMPMAKVEEPEQTTYLPPLLAISCAWLIALLRGILGVLQHEGMGVDMGLTAFALIAIPLIVFYICRAERRHSQALERDATRRRGLRLVLISNH